MKRLLDILPQILENAPDSPELKEAVVFTIWRRSAGKTAAANAIAVKFENGRLGVAVKSEAWRKELAELAPQLLYKLNAILGRSVVKKIDLFVDEKAFHTKSLAERDESMKSTAVSAPLPLRNAAGAIKDEQLRRSFLKAAAGSLAHKAKYGR